MPTIVDYFYFVLNFSKFTFEMSAIVLRWASIKTGECYQNTVIYSLAIISQLSRHTASRKTNVDMEGLTISTDEIYISA